ncbi:hypothetical protein [Litoreibacter janthinus]|uniref:Uncharacterized protein n=1 Tax=Litoreibacter janthinus TaxID=670154 RepID=A0A1I6G742_9RHOB|nr:hypothetical protein [Litoreibacter janthinus]SFR38005.1 hypothetical protein SAMN04488002_0998 [Litoreibacter janthinus]
MAFAAILLGSGVGLLSFGAAWLFYDYSLPTSFGVYLLTSVVFAVLIAILKSVLCVTHSTASDLEDMPHAQDLQNSDA